MSSRRGDIVNYTYNTILGKAKTCQSNVKKEYKLGITSRWSYYFAKAILTPKKDILFIIGDLNAKVESQEIIGVTGKFGLGIMVFQFVGHSPGGYGT